MENVNLNGNLIIKSCKTHFSESAFIKINQYKLLQLIFLYLQIPYKFDMQLLLLQKLLSFKNILNRIGIKRSICD